MQINSQATIFAGMLVQHRYGDIGRVINITTNPYWIEGIHSGEPDIVAYAEFGEGTEYWLVKDLTPIAQSVAQFDAVTVRDQFGKSHRGLILATIGDDIVIHLDDDAIYLIHSSYIVSVESSAAQSAA